MGFARPDRWSQGRASTHAHPWHAVEAHRPPTELDGEVELAVCGAIVQVWGSQDVDRVTSARSACPECIRLTTTEPAAEVAAPPVAPPEQPTGERHLRVVS